MAYVFGAQQFLLDGVVTCTLLFTSRYHDCASLLVAPSATVDELKRMVQRRIPVAMDDFLLYRFL